VSIRQGQIVLMVMPSGPSSTDAVFANPKTPA
jgi:hypothetical protein